jgi:hypothetical protein
MIEPEDVYEMLPKRTALWETSDVAVWLQLNGLDTLIPTFSTEGLIQKQWILMASDCQNLLNKL